MKDYKIVISTWAGVKKTEITDFLELSFHKEINKAGVLTFSLPWNHSAITYLVNNAQVAVYYKDIGNGIPWTKEFDTLFKDKKYAYKGNEGIYTATCYGMLSILGWREILWYTGVDWRTRFTEASAKRIMQALVDYNICPAAAVINGRLREGLVANVSIEAYGDAGNTVSWECAFENLLENLQKLQLIAGGDFDLIHTGPQTWQFRWYTGFEGTDHTVGNGVNPEVIFSLDNRNMEDPVYTKNLNLQKTAMLVGGQGNETARVTEVVTGNGYVVGTDPWPNDVEGFVDGRDATTAAALQDVGNAELAKVKAQATIDFTVIQTNTCAYGLHYVEGDLVTVSFVEDLEMRIMGITKTLSKDRVEKIDIDLKVYP